MTLRLATALATAGLAVGCEPATAREPDAGPAAGRADAEACVIPCDEIDRGSRRRDQVPPLDGPEALPAADACDVLPDDLVIGVEAGGEARAYPLRVLARHEVVNDVVGGRRLAVVHAPLTGATTVFDLDEAGLAGGFGNTGGLYESDLVLYDRATGSEWSHLLRQAIRGPRRGHGLRALPAVRATLQAWQQAHPETTVVTTDTGHRDIEYDGDPYAWYAADHDRLLAPVRYLDLRLRRKEPVLGLAAPGGQARAYPIAALGPRAVLADELGGRPVLVVIDDRAGAASAFDPRLDGDALGFELLEPGAGPAGAFMRDRATGSLWTSLGRAVAGPLAGRRLALHDGQYAYWFAWAAFNRDTGIYEHERAIGGRASSGGRR